MTHFAATPALADALKDGTVTYTCPDCASVLPSGQPCRCLSDDDLAAEVERALDAARQRRAAARMAARLARPDDDRPALAMVLAPLVGAALWALLILAAWVLL